MAKSKKQPKKGIQVRVDADLKKQVEEIFERIGIDTPTAVRMFFKKVVVSGGIPFHVSDSYYQYTPEQMREIEEAYEESLDSENVSGPFASTEEMFEDMRKQP